MYNEQTTFGEVPCITYGDSIYDIKVNWKDIDIEQMAILNYAGFELKVKHGEVTISSVYNEAVAKLIESELDYLELSAPDIDWNSVRGDRVLLAIIGLVAVTRGTETRFIDIFDHIRTISEITLDKV